MFRSRFVRALLMLAGIGGVLYILVSLFLPSSRRLIVGVDKRTGEVRLVRQHVTFLPPHRFYTLSFEKQRGAAQRDGLIRIQSQEGVPVTISYRLRFQVGSSRLPDPRRLATNGWNAWLGARVAEAVSAVTSHVSIEELLSPTSQFAARREVLRRVVAEHLKRSGLEVSDFAIARVEADRDALLKFKRAELRRLARGVAGRVAIFAIDGADWELLSELSNDGRIPNIAALVKGGTSGSMQTIQPTVSPMLWTTVATGLPADRHGIIDFMEPSTHAPVDAYARRAPALWEISEAFGRPAEVVNWWAAWPPSAGGAAVFDTPGGLLENAAYPADLAPRVKAAVVPDNTVGYAQVARFINIPPADYQRSVQQGDPGDPVNVLRRNLVKMWSDHRAAMEIYGQRRPLLMMMSYDGTDQVNHLFGPYHPPYREGVDADTYRRYWPAVANYYSEVDRLIGEWMHVLSDDTTVIIVSAHGFRWDGRTRPRTAPAGRSALSDHRNPGIFIAYGNHVAPSRGTHSLTLYDVAPTVLAVLGLPKSDEMPGQVAQWAFRDVTPVSSVRVVSYNEFFAGRPLGGQRVDPQLYQKTLQAVGHLNDSSQPANPIFEGSEQVAVAQPLPPDKWGTYAWYNNQGVELRKQGKLKEAAETFAHAIELNPNYPVGYLNLAMTLFDRQQYTAADETFLTAIQKGLPNGDRWLIDFAALYRKGNMTSRAIALLAKGRQIYPQSYAISANLGSALAQADRLTEALPELERALSMQPSSTLALNNLGIYYVKKEDYARALDFWNRSLAIDGRQAEIRNAAAAVRTRL